MLATYGDILIVPIGEVLLASSPYRPRMMLNTLQYTRQTHTAKKLSGLMRQQCQG